MFQLSINNLEKNSFISIDYFITQHTQDTAQFSLILIKYAKYMGSYAFKNHTPFYVYNNRKAVITTLKKYIEAGNMHLR